MSLWDYVTGFFRKNATQRYTTTIPTQRVTPTLTPVAMKAGTHYVRLWLAEMFLHRRVDWFQAWYPGVHSLVNIKAGNVERELPNVADATRVGMQQGGSGDVIARNFALTPWIPFNGGTVSLNAGLIGVPGQNYLQNFLGVLSKFAGILNVTQFSSTLKLAEPLALGIQNLFGGSNGRLHLGFFDTYGQGSLSSGYIVAIRAAEHEVDANNLRVIDGRLRTGVSATNHTPYEEFDHMLFRVEIAEERDDFDQLTTIDDPFQKALEALPKEEATHHLQAALLAAMKADELVENDRRRVIETLKTRFRERKSQMSVSGFVPPAAASLGKIMRMGLTPAQAARMGPATMQDVFDS